MNSQKNAFIREIRTPQGNAKICELYHNNSETLILIKIRGKIYTFPVDYLLTELTKDFEILKLQ